MDVDGTAVPHREHTSPSLKVIDAIAKAQLHISVSVATSRPIFMAKGVIEALGITGPCTVNDATQIYDPVSGTIRETLYIDSQYIPIVKHIFDQTHHAFMVNLGDREYMYETGELPDNICGLCVPDITPDTADELIREVTAQVPLAVYKVPSYKKGLLWVTVAHPNATKLHGVLRIAQLIHVFPKDIIGIGDGYNDFPLLEACGLKVAMGNATPELKAIADFIAPSVDEDGVATVIEKFILGN